MGAFNEGGAQRQWRAGGSRADADREPRRFRDAARKQALDVGAMRATS